MSWSGSEIFFLECHPLIPIFSCFPCLFLNKMVPFSFGLVVWHNYAQMELIFLTLDDFSNSLPHLTNEIYVKLAVKLVAFIFFKPLDRLTFAKMLPHNSNNSFLHFFFQNVIFTFSVNLIQEFLFALFISVASFFLRHCNFSLMFEILLKHLVVLTRQSFHSDCHLFPEVVVTVLAVRPHNQLLEGQNVRRLRLRLS